MRSITVISLLFLLFSCRGNMKNREQVNKKQEPLVIPQGEIYIGKKFYEGDELNHFLYKTGGFLTNDSIISYSVYEDDFQIIYSIEKQISYEDVREYLIIDTLQLKKGDYYFMPYPLSENIILKNGNESYKYDFKNEIIIRPNLQTKQP